MIHALLCGIYGSLASVLGKIALSENWIVESVFTYCEGYIGKHGENLCSTSRFCCRGFFFVSMLFLNTMMVASFLRAMSANLSIVVTVLSTATNYLITGALARLLFDENLGSWWVTGSLIICCGLCLVSLSQEIVGCGEKSRTGKDNTDASYRR